MWKEFSKFTPDNNSIILVATDSQLLDFELVTFLSNELRLISTNEKVPLHKYSLWSDFFYPEKICSPINTNRNGD